MGSGGRTKSKSRKLIRQTVALELSFLESNVRVLADELAELNGSVDVYQYRDDDDDDDGGGDATAAGYRADRYLDGFGHDSMTSGGADQQHAAAGKRRRPRQMPMIAVPLKDTRPIDFGPPLEVSETFFELFFFCGRLVRKPHVTSDVHLKTVISYKSAHYLLAVRVKRLKSISHEK